MVGGDQTRDDRRGTRPEARRERDLRPDPEGQAVRGVQLLERLAKGFSNKEIANLLNLSLDTVRTHLRHIYEKLHVHSRTEALARYFEK